MKAKDTLLDSRDLWFEMIQDGIVQLSFGRTRVRMTLDSAYELQYQLAAFLAEVEIKEYPMEQEDEAPGIMEGRRRLEALAFLPKLTSKGEL